MDKNSKKLDKLQREANITLILGIVSSINLSLGSFKTLGYILLALNIFPPLLHFINNSYYKINCDKIKHLYQYFIKNYNQLNKIFYLNNPIEIYAMFTYLLDNGYLSKNKNFKYSTKNLNDIYNLLGTDVINGHGCCRHISSMFCDILNNYGVESCNLCVYLGDSIVYNNDELTKLIIDGKIMPTDFITIISDEVLKNKDANHVITMSIKDNKIYLLDPTNNESYKFNEDDRTLLYTDECNKIPIDLEGTIYSNRKYVNFIPNITDSYSKLLQNKYSSISIEEEKNIIKDTIYICSKNLDIFEKFYNENCELYDEISDKVLKLKNKRLF